jgi:hypothetical protein
MKRNRHIPRQQKKFLLSANEPVGMADLYKDFFADLPESLRRNLPSEVLKEEVRQHRERHGYREP